MGELRSQAWRWPPMLGRCRPNPRRHIAHLRIGFTPYRKICALARDLDRGVGTAADEDRNAFAAIGLHLRETVLHLVIFAFIGERPFAGPFGPNHIQELAGPGIAFVLVADDIAILPQLGGVAAGDDMQGDAAAGELVDRCKLARKQSRRGKAGPLRNLRR